MVRYAFLFPDVYEVGMSHLGMKILYDAINRRPDAWCERVFSPWPDMQRRHEGGEGIPLFSLESRTPRRGIRSSGHHAAVRDELHQHPGRAGPGGDTALKEQRPDFGSPSSSRAARARSTRSRFADYVDLFVLGDGGAGDCHDTIDCLQKMARIGPSAGGIPENGFARIPGVYVPSLLRCGHTMRTGASSRVSPKPAAARRKSCTRRSSRIWTRPSIRRR